MRLLPLVAATFFMVAGGPYGLEDIIGKAGYGRALLLHCCSVPLVWSLPTSLMVGELASAIPGGGRVLCLGAARARQLLGVSGSVAFAGREHLRHGDLPGGLYAVSQASWSRVGPPATGACLWKLAVVAVCTVWNSARGEGGRRRLSGHGMRADVAVHGDDRAGHLARNRASCRAWVRLSLHAAATAERDMAGAVSVCLWNYMGWDNASTVAQEVDNPT